MGKAGFLRTGEEGGSCLQQLGRLERAACVSVTWKRHCWGATGSAAGLSHSDLRLHQLLPFSPMRPGWEEEARGCKRAERGYRGALEMCVCVLPRVEQRLFLDGGVEGIKWRKLGSSSEPACLPALANPAFGWSWACPRGVEWEIDGRREKALWAPLLWQENGWEAGGTFRSP